MALALASSSLEAALVKTTNGSLLLQVRHEATSSFKGCLTSKAPNDVNDLLTFLNLLHRCDIRLLSSKENVSYDDEALVLSLLVELICRPDAVKTSISGTMKALVEHLNLLQKMMKDSKIEKKPNDQLSCYSLRFCLIILECVCCKNSRKINISLAGLFKTIVCCWMEVSNVWFDSELLHRFCRVCHEGCDMVHFRLMKHFSLENLDTRNSLPPCSSTDVQPKDLQEVNIYVSLVCFISSKLMQPSPPGVPTQSNYYPWCGANLLRHVVSYFHMDPTYRMLSVVASDASVGSRDDQVARAVRNFITCFSKSLMLASVAVAGAEDVPEKSSKGKGKRVTNSKKSAVQEAISASSLDLTSHHSIFSVLVNTLWSLLCFNNEQSNGSFLQSPCSVELLNSLLDHLLKASDVKTHPCFYEGFFCCVFSACSDNTDPVSEADSCLKFTSTVDNPRCSLRCQDPPSITDLLHPKTIHWTMYLSRFMSLVLWKIIHVENGAEEKSTSCMVNRHKAAVQYVLDHADSVSNELKDIERSLFLFRISVLSAYWSLLNCLLCDAASKKLMQTSHSTEDLLQHAFSWFNKCKELLSEGADTTNELRELLLCQFLVPDARLLYGLLQPFGQHQNQALLLTQWSDCGEGTRKAYEQKPYILLLTSQLQFVYFNVHDVTSVELKQDFQLLDRLKATVADERINSCLDRIVQYVDVLVDLLSTMAEYYHSMTLAVKYNDNLLANTVSLETLVGEYEAIMNEIKYNSDVLRNKDANGSSAFSLFYESLWNTLDVGQLRGWLQLLTAKVCLTVYGAHSVSMVIAKSTASSWEQGYPSPYPRRRCMLAAMLLSPQNIVPELESYMLIATIHEQTGNILSSPAYISEAKLMMEEYEAAFAGAVGPSDSVHCSFIHSLFYLSTIRIWTRLQKQEHLHMVEEYLSGCDVAINCNDDIDRLSYVGNEVEDLSKSSLHNLTDKCLYNISQHIACVRQFMPRLACGGCDDVKRDVISLLSFSHSYLYWGNTCVGCDNKATDETSCCFHTCIHYRLRHYIDLTFHARHVSFNPPVCISTINRRASTAVGAVDFFDMVELNPQLADYVLNCRNFDVLRYIRRKISYKLLSVYVEGNNTFGSSLMDVKVFLFVLYAASCSTSWDCGVRSSTPTYRLDDVVLKNPPFDYRGVIRHACLGNMHSVGVIMEELCWLCRNAVGSGADKSMSTGDAMPTTGRICCVLYDKQLKRLSLSSFGEQNEKMESNTVSLSVGSKYEDLIARWTTCMSDNKSQLSGLPKNETELRHWEENKTNMFDSWKRQRDITDQNMETIMIELQALIGSEWLSIIFNAEIADFAAVETCSLLSDSRTSSHASNESDVAHRVATTCETNAVEVVAPKAVVPLVDYGAMKVTELRRLMKERGLSALGLKKELVDRLMADDKNSDKKRKAEDEKGSSDSKALKVKDTSISSKRQTSASGTVKKTRRTAKEGGVDEKNSSVSDVAAPVVYGQHVILMIDEYSQCLPWECLPCLKSRSCSRVPSLSLLLDYNTRIRNDSGAGSAGDTVVGTDIPKSEKDARIWYVVDPLQNLSRTRYTMSSFLQPYVDKYGWDGYVAEVPPPDAVRSNHQSNELFIYTGHGAGESFCDMSTLKNKLSKCPSALLWGCSSGALDCFGVHDPIGIPLLYLQKEAYFVVGSLWDITDKECDRLSMHYMTLLLNQENVARPSGGSCMSDKVSTKEKNSDKRTGSVTSSCSSDNLVTVDEKGPCYALAAHALSLSRDQCQLKKAIGYAPVIYGVPPPAAQT